jgi:hypothetical protein
MAHYRKPLAAAAALNTAIFAAGDGYRTGGGVTKALTRERLNP